MKPGPESLHTPALSFRSLGATPVSPTRLPNEGRQRNDAKWLQPDAYSGDDQSSVEKLQKLLAIQDSANLELIRQREDLEKQIRIQRKLISFLRSKVKALGAQLQEDGYRVAVADTSQDIDARRNRVKSLNNALMRIRGVDAAAAEPEFSIERIEDDEFLPIHDPVDRKALLKSEIAQLQAEVRGWLSRVARMARLPAR